MAANFIKGVEERVKPAFMYFVGGIEHVWTALVLLLKSIFLKAKHGDNTMVASPKVLKTEVERSALRLKIPWGSGCVAMPNRYDVFFDQQSWEMYYGVRRDEVCDRISRIVAEYADRVGCTIESDLMVTTSCDRSLPQRTVKVVSSYFRAAGVPARPVAREDDNRADDAKPAETALSMPQGESDGTELTPSNKVACLVAPFLGAPRRISNGTTVGVLRYANRIAPDIQLDELDGVGTVSHLHAAFDMSPSGTWSIVSYGKNGTNVIRDGNTISLGMNERKLLENDDIIVLAGAESTRMTVYVGREANNKLMEGQVA